MAVDWTEIKQDYVSCEDSMRTIAARHGIAHSTLQRKVKLEGWKEERAAFSSILLANQAKAQGEAQAQEMTEGLRECIRVAKKMLLRIEEKLDGEEYLGARALHDLGDALKDLRDIMTSDLDVRRKQADIEKLRREIDGPTQQEAAGGVIIMPEILPEGGAEDG